MKLVVKLLDEQHHEEALYESSGGELQGYLGYAPAASPVSHAMTVLMDEKTQPGVMRVSMHHEITLHTITKHSPVSMAQSNGIDPCMHNKETTAHPPEHAITHCECFLQV